MKMVEAIEQVLFSSVEEALTAFQKGYPVIVVDDEERENEGDLIYAAECMTEKKLAFMLQHTSGIICVPMTAKRLQEIDVPLMVQQNTAHHSCAFTVSVDAKGTQTGVSAADRLLTIQTLTSDTCQSSDLVKPGHMFPLRSIEGGVLKRAGHTEAAIDLCKLAQCKPVAVLAELMNANGTMMRLPELREFSRKQNISLLSIAQIIAYRRQRETLIVRENAIHLPTHVGDFILIPYTEQPNGPVHLALVKGNVSEKESVLVRVHSECLTGDVFGSQRCDCGSQLVAALEMLEKEGTGILLYMRQEGRGIGLMNKLNAYHLQEKGFDTVEANLLLGFKPDLRDYGIGAQILKDLGVQCIRLLTNNPKKVVGLEGHGLEIVARIPLQISPTTHNKNYLAAKKEQFGHLFDIV